MPIYKKRKNHKKYIIWTMLIILVVLMIISFSPNQYLTETVLWP